MDYVCVVIHSGWGGNFAVEPGATFTWNTQRGTNHFMTMLTGYHINDISGLWSNFPQNLYKLYFQTIILAWYLIRFKPSSNLFL